MGKKSVKENKNIYQITREENGLTRAGASELIGCISESRIEKIESEKSPVQPDEVMMMAKAYGKPELCNLYCSSECPIGKEYVPEVSVKELSRIVVEMLASLNTLNHEKDSFIEMSTDDMISDDEIENFAAIEDGLEKISVTSAALNLWIQNQISAGKIDAEKLKEALAKLNDK